ncbi:hypothetical protein [Piscibacillus halophilus]|nr:hypothetical protein [Piscibacillus halophilus]
MVDVFFYMYIAGLGLAAGFLSIGWIGYKLYNRNNNKKNNKKAVV